MRILASPQLQDKKILLIEKESKKHNDRTWCFWETKPGFFEAIVFRQWSQLDFYGDGFHRTLDIQPYVYKMIRGEDFYSFSFNEIARHPNVQVLYGDLKIDTSAGHPYLTVNGNMVNTSGAILFNSIYFPEATHSPDSIRLLQHFKGWIIETKQPVFDASKATLMDFRVHQQHGTAFTYVLPHSPNRALVEYTLFTRSVLQQHEYDEELRKYLGEFLQLDSFDVLEEEFGVIPMTNERFEFYRDGMYYIGAAGGQTKASSGYTFQFIQKQSQQIVDQLAAGKALHQLPTIPKRFRFYDNTLLHILYHRSLPGKTIFSTLFKKNNAAQVLKFLDNETKLAEELKIISTLPKKPFLLAAIFRK